MILQSLAAFARRESLVEDPCFQYAGVTWAIDVGANGEFRALFDLRSETGEGKKKRLLPRQMLIPKRSKRTVAPLAEFLVDKPEYVLGLGEEDPARLEGRRQLFAGAVRAAAQESGCDEADSVVQFLDSAEARTTCAQKLSESGYASNDLLCFRRGGVFLHDLDAMKEYWRKRSKGKEGGAAQCLVCGALAPIARLHPDIKGLAGPSTKGVPIVSFNKEAFWSYGLENNQNAPVCEGCADAYTKALNRCLTDQLPDPADKESKLPRQSHRLSENLTAVYWADESSSGIEKVVDGAINDPEVARALLDAPWRGGSVTSRPLAFHCLLLQGAQGRATVRSYVADTVDGIRDSVRRWLDDTNVGMPRALSLLQMLSGLAVRRGAPGLREARGLPPGLWGEMYLAVLFGRAIPRNALQLALVRNRAEANVNYNRAALVQAWVNRNPAFKERKKLVSLDPEYPSAAYQLGRLLAICESVQYRQRGGNANKTVVDRYFPALSTRPRFVFAQLMRLTELHLGKLQRQGEARYQRAKVAEVVGKLAPGDLPAHLSLEEQALFALGFYHQRQENFGKAAAPSADASQTVLLADNA
jgi:CRISPR-associated protein Csd1